MHVPEPFAFPEHDAQVSFARRHNFATLVSTDASMPYASHVPLLVDDEEGQVILRGHFARANRHSGLIESGEHLAIFHGPHAYISPTWYRDPGVPTWNFVAVHMSGEAEPVDDPGELATLVEELSRYHEQGSPAPWTPHYAPAMLRAIRGFRIRVAKIEGKRKLSQNRSAEDRAGVIEALSAPFGRAPDTEETNLRKLMLENEQQ